MNDLPERATPDGIQGGVIVDVKPQFPDAATVGTKRITIGHKSYAILSAVIRAGGRAKMGTVKRLTYGDGDVSRARLDNSICRTNRKLAAVGCQRRLAVDGGEIVLL